MALMKIGMLTGIWYIAMEMSLFESLERVAEHGFRHVDLHGVFHAGPKQLSAQKRKEVRPHLDSLGLIPRNYVLHAPCNLASATQTELESAYEYLCQGIDMAVSWGVNQLMLNSGMWDFKRSRKDSWDRAVWFYQRLCDYAAPRDLFIAQETEPYVWFLVNDCVSSARMMSDVNRPNFVNLIDMGHVALARETDDNISLLGDTLVHAHMSDHEPLRHTNQTVGTGFTPVAECLQMLDGVDADARAKRFGYDELVISFELGFPGDVIADPDDWVKRSIQHVQTVAPHVTLT
jgi:sugar phosphate isomerase/epimerase